MTNPALKLRLVQANPVVGDITGNRDLAIEALREAGTVGRDLVVFSELFLTGYPPEDLLLKNAFLDTVDDALADVRAATRNGPAALIGVPMRRAGKLYNAAVLLVNGETAACHLKRDLPNYGVFDEKRLFAEGEGAPAVYTLAGVKIGIAICEDLWFRRVPDMLKAAGCDAVLAPNASPWRRTIQAERHAAFGQWSDLNLPYVFVNQVGGQDELVFDGASFAMSGDGQVHQLCPEFEPATADLDVMPGGNLAPVSRTFDLSGDLEAEYRAAVLGLGDYVRKNRFPGVVLGLSGGIDSALTAAIAVDALGPDRVWALMMPSRYTANDSLHDAEACAQALGVRYDVMAIKPGMDAFDSMLGDLFAGTEPDVTEENIQSRLRGSLLMAVSNKFGHMVVTTGNKSEMAVGYATLYGDMNGGYNPLKDFYKTEVFALSRWRNGTRPRGGLGPDGVVIPERIITRPPSAELRDDQRDEDSLPPYEVLDHILRALIDGDADVCDLVDAGHDEALVRRIEHLVYVAEYKRRQAPPGVKIGPRNFGRDRRYPITNAWRDD